jgi:hypothetical protein
MDFLLPLGLGLRVFAFVHRVQASQKLIHLRCDAVLLLRAHELDHRLGVDQGDGRVRPQQTHLAAARSQQHQIARQLVHPDLQQRRRRPPHHQRQLAVLRH